MASLSGDCAAPLVDCNTSNASYTLLLSTSPLAPVITPNTPSTSSWWYSSSVLLLRRISMLLHHPPARRYCAFVVHVHGTICGNSTMVSSSPANLNPASLEERRMYTAYLTPWSRVPVGPNGKRLQVYGHSTQGSPHVHAIRKRHRLL